MNTLEYGGTTDPGFDMEFNEDAMGYKKLDEDCLCCIVADGMGGTISQFRIANLICRNFLKEMEIAYETMPEIFENNKLIVKYMSRVFQNIGKIVEAFRVANDSVYGGFFASATAILINKKDICFVHVGNSRLYLIRKNKEQKHKIKKITRDDTKGQQLVDEEELTEQDYYLDDSKMILTNAFGITDMSVQKGTFKAKDEDYILLTTDGIHFAIVEDAIKNIIIDSSTWQDACTNLIRVSKKLEYRDNSTAFIIKF